jgi:hypothetical protein
MMKKFNLLITESERERILGLHKKEKKNIFINEQVPGTIEKKQFPVQNLGDLFDLGKYQSEKVKQTILSLKPQIDTFIKNSDSRNFIVNITAGESQVTNPKGFEVKGSLALARANEVKKYFEEIFPDLIKSGVLRIDSPSDVKDVTIGQTDYVKGDQLKPEKLELYKKEQYVKFSIVGQGAKITPVEDKRGFCRKTRDDASGSYLPASKDFTSIKELNFDEGEGPFFISLETWTMPDILYFEYNGKILPDAKNIGFRGDDADWTRLLVGTSLRIKYGDGGSLPPQYTNTTYQPIDINNKQFYSALDDCRKWGMKKSFINVFGPGQEFENEEFLSILEKFDSDGNKKSMIKSLGDGFKWGYLTSPILGSYYRNIPANKVEGVNSMKIINVAPKGGTAWNFAFRCNET